MTRRGNVAVTLAALVCLLLCSGPEAIARTATTPQERAALQRAMTRYARALAATTVSEVHAQMAAEEKRIAPCAERLRNIYAYGNANVAYIDELLGAGVHDTGELWSPKAAIPLDRAIPGARASIRSSWLAGVRATTHIDVCGAVEKWAGESYGVVARSRVYRMLMREYTPSPLAFIGTRMARALAGWGFPKTDIRQLVAALNRGLARYQALNQDAGEQYMGWLRKQGIFRSMRPVDRSAVDFSRY